MGSIRYTIVMRFLIYKITFIGVAMIAVIFSFSNTSYVFLAFWPFLGGVQSPLFAVVLVVFAIAFLMGYAYGAVSPLLRAGSKPTRRERDV